MKNAQCRITRKEKVIQLRKQGKIFFSVRVDVRCMGVCHEMTLKLNNTGASRVAKVVPSTVPHSTNLPLRYC